MITDERGYHPAENTGMLWKITGRNRDEPSFVDSAPRDISGCISCRMRQQRACAQFHFNR